jgi:tetratricopeptide (TPR) repeat protein
MGNRRFAWTLAALVAGAAAVRALMLWEYLLENPFAGHPYSDGDLYWSRAGEMAAGSWVEPTPFLIAPLYSYLLGTLRWLGGGLASLYVVQTALHLATGALLADAARARFGARTSLVAVALFFLLAEPALFSSRVLSVTVQTFLATLLWWDWAHLAGGNAPGGLRVTRVGIWVGLLALAFPAALLLIPAYAAWLVSEAPAGRRSLARAALGAGAALLVIAPATLHNAARSGEFIPVSAHGGITLAQGNGPRSVGIYTPLDDVSASIDEQHHDAARVFERAHGRVGSWGEVDAHLRRRAVDWWMAEPAEAAALFARKLFWFASARRYDNVALFAFEREHGLGRSAALAPLEVPWLLGAALLGALLVAHERRRRAVPELALLALPLLVCLVFYYSARYRLLAVPIVCVLAALAASRWRALPGPRPLAAALALLPLPLLMLNEAMGLEHLDQLRTPYSQTLAHHYVLAGAARETQGDSASAATRYRRAIAADAGNVEAHRRLYNLQASAGELSEAAATLEGLLAAAPRDVPARMALAWLLASAPDPSVRRPHDATRHAAEAVRLSDAESAEAWLVLAVAEAARGRFDDAGRALERAGPLAQGAGDAALLANLESLAALVHREQAVYTQPRLLRGAAG